jgi:hypothetical protein
MKPRAISFSPPMVRANFAGRKVQTRRNAKARSGNSLLAYDEDTPRWADSYIMDEGNRDWLLRDAPAKPGQLLYMTEAWHTLKAMDRVPPSALGVTNPIFFEADVEVTPPVFEDGEELGKYRPAMHLPMRFTRATLHVDDVRIERLQDITDDDAIAEGLEIENWSGFGDEPHLRMPEPDYYRGFPGADWQESPVVAYRELFEHINGPGSWDANPLVWVISYRFEPVPITQVLERLAAA